MRVSEVLSRLCVLPNGASREFRDPTEIAYITFIEQSMQAERLTESSTYDGGKIYEESDNLSISSGSHGPDGRAASCADRGP